MLVSFGHLQRANNSRVRAKLCVSSDLGDSTCAPYSYAAVATARLRLCAPRRCSHWRSRPSSPPPARTIRSTPNGVSRGEYRRRAIVCGGKMNKAGNPANEETPRGGGCGGGSCAQPPSLSFAGRALARLMCTLPLRRLQRNDTCCDDFHGPPSRPTGVQSMVPRGTLLCACCCSRRA